MSERDTTLTIVYQFGKVASTSLVNTLKADRGLEVHQSHFLGEHALQRIIPIAVDKSTNAYFHEHLRGQLLSNVELTYRMNRVLAGEGAAKLKVISLSREPVDWLRSGILQDIVGYRPDLMEFARKIGCASDDESVVLRHGLTEVLRRIGDIVDDKGGVGPTVAEFHDVGGKAMLAPTGHGADLIVRRLFFLALRPLTWFDEHFRPCFGFGLEDFDRDGVIWIARRSRADFAILRYEDIAVQFGAAMSLLGLVAPGALLKDNVSKTKAFAGDVSAAFQSEAAAGLRARLVGSEYSRFFGYGDATAHRGTAAE